MRFPPLNEIQAGPQGGFGVDKHVVEFAVLGFESGYSLGDPTSWGFGKPISALRHRREVIHRPVIACSESKWPRAGPVMLLPHGYEGKVQEHSSARVEKGGAGSATGRRRDH